MLSCDVSSRGKTYAERKSFNGVKKVDTSSKATSLVSGKIKYMTDSKELYRRTVLTDLLLVPRMQGCYSTWGCYLILFYIYSDYKILFISITT